jgi:outer membrane lipoprotein SlyB
MKTQAWGRVLVLAMLAAFVAGCQSGTQTEETPSTGAAQSEPSGGRRAKRAEGASKSAPPAPQPTTVTVTVPAGTTLEVRLAEALDSGSTETGATFEGTLAAPLSAGGVEIAPVGSTVTGKVTNAVSSGRLNKPAELELTLISLKPRSGGDLALSTSTWSMKGESHKKRNIEMIGGGAAAGALVGALTGGKKGAAIGSAIGAGGGTGVAAATGKKEIRLDPETKLAFKLNAPVSYTFTK